MKTLDRIQAMLDRLDRTSTAPGLASLAPVTERRSLKSRRVNAASLAGKPVPEVNGWCRTGYRWSR